MCVRVLKACGAPSDAALVVPALQLCPWRARSSPGSSGPVWSLLCLDAIAGQTLEQPHVNCAFGCVPCRGGLEAFRVSFDDLPRLSHRKGESGSTGEAWRREESVRICSWKGAGGASSKPHELASLLGMRGDALYQNAKMLLTWFRRRAGVWMALL